MSSITVKKEKHDRAGSNKKINFGMLRLLETLTLVSTNQFRQMNRKKTEKVHLQLQEKPPENHRLWDHMVQTTNNTQDKLESLAIKVDHFIRASEHSKESHQSSNATPPNQIKLIKPLLNLVDGVMNVTQRLAMKLMTGPRKPITFTSLPPKVSLMGHIDALSLSLRHEDKPPKITKVTQEALR